MRIGIFGGSFDPPTRSHQAMVKDCLQKKIVDEVWVCPSYCHPDKENQTSFEHRIKMSKLMFNGMFSWLKSNVKVCDYEKYNKSGRTCSLLWKLQKNFPQHTFKIIIGQDCADNIQEWMNWTILINENPFIVFYREDYVSFIKNPWYYQNPHLFIKNNDCWMSSTYTREMLQQKYFEIVKLIITKPSIVKYVIKHKLYS